MKLNDSLESVDKEMQTLSLQFREKYEETWDEELEA